VSQKGIGITIWLWSVSVATRNRFEIGSEMEGEMNLKQVGDEILRSRLYFQQGEWLNEFGKVEGAPRTQYDAPPSTHKRHAVWEQCRF
jgi:hypothetical protein